ncbi:MAG: hypothetical protein GY906_08605 [bacterium]|nr:hypothetical protein [bacterium]
MRDLVICDVGAMGQDVVAGEGMGAINQKGGAKPQDLDTSLENRRAGQISRRWLQVFRIV